MEANVPPGSICCFCLTAYDDEALYGKFYKLSEIRTHYFCLLLSSKIQQRGSDEEGILGFLATDIRTELKRGKNLMCTFCQKRGATISCHNSKCRVHFHLPCGRSRDTFHEFFGEFKSFCCKHRIKQRIKQEIVKAMCGKQSTCYICLEPVPATPCPNTLWAPCCSKDAWFHRLCIQRLALSAGYFFKCPLCNNTGKFVEAMRACGIWIPEQDASWERDPERYEGLLQRHNSCDAELCHCTRGRDFQMENTKWEIKLCVDCGSQGMHVECGNLRKTQDWVCPVCSSIASLKGASQNTRKLSVSRQAIQSRNMARRALPQRVGQRITRRVARFYHPPVEDEHPADTNVETVTPECSLETLKENLPLPAFGVNNSEERKPSCPSPTSENADVEIFDVSDHSDDEIQILPSPNIRVIKTNIGISVPVVKVDANAPGGGERVVASGEPCMDEDTGKEVIQVVDEPSTSSVSETVQRLDKISEVLVRGEPPQSPPPPSPPHPSPPAPDVTPDEDDDCVVEFEKTSRTLDIVKRILKAPGDSALADVSARDVGRSAGQGMACDRRFRTSGDSVSIERLTSGVPRDSYRTQPTVPSKSNSSDQLLTSAIHIHSHVDVSIVPDGGSSSNTRPSVHMETSTPHPAISSEISLTKVPDDVTEGVQVRSSTGGLFNGNFYSTSKSGYAASVPTSAGGRLYSLISPALQPMEMMPTPTVLQHVTSVASGSSMTSTATQAPFGTSQYPTAAPHLAPVSSTFLANSTTAPMSTSFVRDTPTFLSNLPELPRIVSTTSLAFRPATNPEISWDPCVTSTGCSTTSSDSMFQLPSIVSTTSIAKQDYDSTPETTASAVYSRLPSTMSYGNVSPLHPGPTPLGLPGRQDDWTVHVLPPCVPGTAKDTAAVAAAQQSPPDVLVMERFPGPVPSTPSLWTRHGEPAKVTTEENEFVVVDDDDYDDGDDGGRRRRRRRLSDWRIGCTTSAGTQAEIGGSSGLQSVCFCF